MALVLYKIGDNGTQSEVDNVTNKVTSFHDTSDGSYTYNKFYITNEPETIGYTNIEVGVYLDGVKDGPIGLNGIVYQLLAINSDGDLPDSNLWEHLPYNNSLSFPDMEINQPSSHYFVLRTYVPKGKGATYISEAKLKITAVEII